MGDTTWILAVLLLVTGGAAGCAWLSLRRSRRDAVRVRDAAKAIAEDGFDNRAPLQLSGPLGEIAASLNRLAEETGTRMERLRDESGELEALIGSMREGVLALDAEGRMLRVNPAAMKMFDFNGDPHGLKLWEAVRLPGLQEKVAPALKEGRPIRVTVPVGDRTVAGGLVPAGVGTGAVLVARDVTEERRYDALRQEFVANVSHELRTPLTLISGYVETLREGALEDRTQGREFLEIVDRNVKHLSALVDDLLDLSKLDSGTPATEFRQVRILDVVDRAVATYRPLAEKRGQTLEVTPGEDPGELRGDPDLLERALANLVDNAIKYTPEGGTIRIRTSAPGGKVEVSVEDSGAGIPESDQGRIFERFYRVDKSRSREMGGTGLGLAIVKHIAQLHGGEVTVDSRAGSGTTFTLKLPRG